MTLLLLLLAGCRPTDQPPPDPVEVSTPPPDTTARPVPPPAPRLGEVLRSAASGTFHRALEQAGMTGRLENDSAFTLFAPPDAAFAAVPESLRTAQHLQGYLLPDPVLTADLAGTITLLTAAGTELTLQATDTGLTVTDAAGHTARIVQADLRVGGGVVHIIDTPFFAVPPLLP